MPVQLPPIDEDVYAALQERAIPLEDDINSVIRRLLGLQDPSGNGASPEPASHEASQSRADEKQPKEHGTRRSAKGPKKKPRAKKGSILSEDEYELPILRSLQKLGGRVPTREVIGHLEEELSDKLTPADRETLGSGLVRWKNRAQFVRLGLIKKGEMVEGSPRGVWEISDAGKERLKREGE